MWESSRGSRELEDWASFLNLCREHSVLIMVCTHGDRVYDVRNGRDWRTLAEDGVDSAYESEKISLRGRRAAASRKAAGRPLGRVSTGYRRVYDSATGRLTGQEPDPEAGPRVRQLITAIADGVPVSRAAKAAGIRHQTALHIARNPANIGMRPGPDGVLVKAQWEPLVGADVFWAAQEVLAGHARAGIRPGAVRALLSHLARCGVCGDVIVIAKVRGEDTYRCKRGHVVYRPVADADDRVMWKLLNYLEQPGVLERFTPADDGEAAAAHAEAARITAELSAAADSYGRAGGISIAALEAIEQRLRPALADAAERARTASVPPALRAFAGAFGRSQAAYEVWLDMDLAAQRDVIRALAQVRINPRGSAERIEVVLT